MARVQLESRENQSEITLLKTLLSAQVPISKSSCLQPQEQYFTFSSSFLCLTVYLAKATQHITVTRPHTPDLLLFAVSFCTLCHLFSSPSAFYCHWGQSPEHHSRAQHGTSRDKLYQQILLGMDNDYKIVLWLESSINRICHNCVIEMDFL